MIGDLPPIEIILSPLISISFDVAEVAEVVDQVRFRGKLRALTTDASNISLIKEEIHALVPDLDFAVFRITDAGDLELV
jgi:hypothetical protein